MKGENETGTEEAGKNEELFNGDKEIEEPADD